MAEFLFEIGLEEVPARMIAGAQAELERRVVTLLERERLVGACERPVDAPAVVKSFSTPRRLAVWVADVAERQEDLCEELSCRHHIVKWVGTQSLPDGSMTERYEFVHALYRQVLYDRQLPGRRARLHRQLGERLAAMYALRIEDVVPELAYHFEQAADYLQQAAQIAGHRYADRQADSIFARALELVSRLPEAERARMEPPAAGDTGRASHGSFRHARHRNL